MLRLPEPVFVSDPLAAPRLTVVATLVLPFPPMVRLASVPVIAPLAKPKFWPAVVLLTSPPPAMMVNPRA